MSVEQICEILSMADPEALVQLINKAWQNSGRPPNVTPTFRTIVDTFIRLINVDPTSADRFAVTIYAASQSRNLCQGLNDNLVNMVHDLILDAAYPALKTSILVSLINQTNPVLLCAMMSGACVRSGMPTSDVQAMLVAQGLQLPGTQWEEDRPKAEDEVYALHACLVLLVGGSRIYNGIPLLRNRWNEIVPALEKLQRKGIVRNKNGQILLQVAINKAKTGFSENLGVPDIWHTLFPVSRRFGMNLMQVARR